MRQMSQIVLARHGQTEWNVAEVFRGRAKIGLNETGRKEAELLAEYLSSLRVEAVYSSPLKRALQTAEVVARRNNLQVKIAPGLIDFDYGEWEGLSNREVQDKYEDLCEVWTNRPEQARMPGGETLADVTKRAVAMIDEVVAKHKEAVVLVTHRVVNKVLVCALLGLDNSHFWNIKNDAGAISIFVYQDGRFVFTKHNDSCYLIGSRGSLIDF